jgi:hypothetical protein
MGEETKAVMLDLVQPHLAGGQCLSFDVLPTLLARADEVIE